MRRLPALLLTAIAVTAISACSAGTAPGWTYAPATSAAPGASGAPPGGPSAGTSTSPTGPIPSEATSSEVPSVAPSAPAASAAPSGAATTITIKAPVGAATGGFDPTTANAPAGAAFTLTFDNQDNTAPHNLVLLNPDGSTKVAVQGDTAFFTGPGQRVYQVPALTAGAYPFKCEIHPTTMLGTITVK